MAYLGWEPDVSARLTARRGRPGESVICLGIESNRHVHIGHVGFNFRVHFVDELIPCDEHGNEQVSAPGNLMTSPEILEDEAGTEYGNGIKYWARSGVEIPGRTSVLSYFRIRMPAPRSFPVRVSIFSEDLTSLSRSFGCSRDRRTRPRVCNTRGTHRNPWIGGKSLA